MKYRSRTKFIGAAFLLSKRAYRVPRLSGYQPLPGDDTRSRTGNSAKRIGGERNEEEIRQLHDAAEGVYEAGD